MSGSEEAANAMPGVENTAPIVATGVCASICRCCKRCCKSEDTSDSPGQSTSARIFNWSDICSCKNCKYICCGIINCCSCYNSVTEPTDPQSNELMATDTGEATASGDENTSLLATAVVHAANAQPTAPPEEGTGLDSSTVTNQPTGRVFLDIDMSHGRQSTHITASSAARGEQTSAGQDSTDAAESQQMADQPAVSTTATSERQSSAGQDSTDASDESQQTDQPAVSTTVTSEGQSSASQDSVHAAESQQMVSQPTISSTATREGQSSGNQDSVDATVAGRNQQTTGPPIVPTGRGIPASTVPSASSEWQPPVSHQPVPPAEAQPPARNPPYSSTNDAAGASSTVSPSGREPRSPNKPVTKKDMRKLANELANWERLAVALNMSKADIHGFKVNNMYDVWNQKYDMLCKWVDRQYNKATGTVGELVIRCQEADVSVEAYEFLLNI